MVRNQDSVDLEAFEFAVGKIADGRLFERFALRLLSQLIGYDFIPIAGNAPGVDGLEYCHETGTTKKTVYQLSIETQPRAKLRKTLAVLESRRMAASRLIYVTNRRVEDQDQLADALFDEFGVVVQVRDVLWMATNVNKSEATIRTFVDFIDTSCHEYTRGDKALMVSDMASDPRLFVFLRQQWEDRSTAAHLDDVLADALILYALEGTDPDKDRLLTRAEILGRIAGALHFPPQKLEERIDTRLLVLSKKPNRRINHHTKDDAYCLPYETRLQIDNLQLKDAALQERFVEQTEGRLKARLSEGDVSVRDVSQLLRSTFSTLFKQQGLEFSQFLTHQDVVPTYLEKSIADVIGAVLEQSAVVPKNRGLVRTALIATVRDIIYSGSADELEYLRRLSHCYMLMFMLQAEPKVAAYFATMAGKLRVFVCTSILIPALSELPLEERHRRHWNLLKKASAAGVQLLVDKAIVGELAAHIRGTLAEYDATYAGQEHLFADDMTIAYVDQMLIRSYLYHRLRGYTHSFGEFVNRFVTPNSRAMNEELVDWLRGEFGIRYYNRHAENLKIDTDDYERLVHELTTMKRSKAQAENDASTILTVHALRERNNELSEATQYGYSTWWLSKDTNTHKAAVKCFPERLKSNCYMRPDFLNHYIALSPRPEQVSRSFDALFPTLVGVSVSHHIPRDLSERVRKVVREHNEHQPARVSAIMRRLSDDLRAGGEGGDGIRLFLDDELGKLKTDALKRANTPTPSPRR